MKRKFKIVQGSFTVAAIGIGLIMFGQMKPLSEDAVREKIQKRMDDVIRKNDCLTSSLFTIYDGKTGRKDQFASGVLKKSVQEPAQTDNPYHAASIEK